jgi:hypothetical protein
MKKKEKRPQKFPLTPMGVLAPGSAHTRPSAQPPIDMSGNLPAHVSAESLLVRAECVRQHNKVAIKLGIIFSSSSLLLSLSRHLLNLQERVVVGFPNFACAPK